MRHAWTEDQELLRSMLARYVGQAHGFEERRRNSKNQIKTNKWKELAELGLLGLNFSEEQGGSGGATIERYVVMEALGAGLVTEPFLASAVLGAGLVQRAADDEQRVRLIAPLIHGDLRLAFGFAEPESRFNLASVTTTAREAGDGYLINGRKSAVYGAPEADFCFVTARTSGAARDSSGITLFLVPLQAEGVSLHAYQCIDGMSAAELSLRDVRVGKRDVFGQVGQALQVVERVVDDATFAICAEAIGIIDALTRKCLEYAKMRTAFSSQIADFQIIQHRLVDMHIACEIAAAAALRAADLLADEAADCRRVVSACKVQVGEEAAFVGKAAVQLHGAIGLTDELDIGHYFKRLMAIQTLFGSTDYHLGRYMLVQNETLRG